MSFIKLWREWFEGWKEVRAKLWLLYITKEVVQICLVVCIQYLLLNSHLKNIFFFLLLPGSYFECDKTQVITQSKEMIHLEECRSLCTFGLNEELCHILSGLCWNWTVWDIGDFCLGTFRLLIKEKQILRSSVGSYFVWKNALPSVVIVTCLKGLSLYLLF